jgi:trans-aconitate methyltransferase
MRKSFVPRIKAWAQELVGSRERYTEHFARKVLADQIQPKVIADLGCGTLTTARKIAKLFPKAAVHAYDVKAHAAEQEDNPTNFHHSVIAPFEFGKQEPKADIVNLGCVAHHVGQEDELRLFQDIHDGMVDSPDSRLFVHEHTLSEHSVRRCIETACLYTAELFLNVIPERMLTRFNFFTRERLLALLHEAGFQVLDDEDVGTNLVTLPSLNTNHVYWCRKR